MKERNTGTLLGYYNVTEESNTNQIRSSPSDGCQRLIVSCTTVFYFSINFTQLFTFYS